jgi:hypothetical protein
MNKASIHFLQKMMFIYNAVLNGWTVQYVNEEFQFKKDSQSASCENVNDFLKTSIQIPEELKQILTETVPQSLQNLI